MVLLVIPRKTWRKLLISLDERGLGKRESGAFLLTSNNSRAVVTDFALYDDLDPECLTGAIDFHGIGYHHLSEHCRNRGLRVIADVHTHPGRHSGQSSIDRQHPMISRTGHIALVIPHFARGRIRPADVGVHCYRADGEWDAWTGVDAARRLKIRWPW